MEATAGITKNNKYGMAYDIDFSPEDQKFLKIISNSDKFKNQFGSSWYPKHQEELVRIKEAASISPDPISFLLKLVKKYEPNYKVWKPNTKISPGKSYDMPMPNVNMGAKAAQYLPNTAQQAKAKVLQDKIAAHNAEIERLKQAQEKATKDYDKAKKQHEELNTFIDEKTLRYFSYIEKHCSEYLTTVDKTNKILFRGQNDVSMPIFIGHPRENRKPSDSDPGAQALYDKYLTLMGFKALRSNSIFASSDKYHAGRYGDIYAIFPINGFQFTWSTNESDIVLRNVGQVSGDEGADAIDDLYHNYDDIIADISNDLIVLMEYTAGINTGNIRKSPVYKALNKSLRQWDKINHPYTPEKLYTTLIEVINNYIAACAEYPKFKNIGRGSYKEVKKYLTAAQRGLKGPEDKGDKVNASKMIKRYGLKKDDLASALKSGHEVCILGNYIAIDYAKYEKQITMYFLKKLSKKSALKRA